MEPALTRVDAALLESDGITLSHTGPNLYRPYSRPERELLRRALADACALVDRTVRPGSSKLKNW
jgi:anhydro-N-acetylmuramic acid kinase